MKNSDTKSNPTQSEQKLVHRKVAARAINSTVDMITYYARKGYIQKYYVLGNNYEYLVDLDEVLKQPELSLQRKSISYNKNWDKQKRDNNGRFSKTS